MTLADVAAATGGTVLPGAAGAVVVTGATIDSRSAVPGLVFVALQAERDGHDFVPAAFAAGAAAAIVARPLAGAGPQVVVADPAAALSALGREARRRLAGTPVVGITGSSGKTSTKDLAAGALASVGAWASQASFNNELGVPITLLGAPDGAGAVIVEMGSRGAGHIAELCAVASPTVGVVVNIGTAHAEFFGSRADVAQAKGELLEALPPGGHAVLNADDDLTPALAARTAATVLTAGLAPGADVRVSGLTLGGDLRPSFTLDTPWGRAEVRDLPLRGAHQAGNAALAVAVAGALGIAPEVAAAGLAGAVGSRWRMELARSPMGVTVLNDAYNANPASMAAAFEALGRLETPGRRFAVVGYMAELGPGSAGEHRRVGRLAGACGLDRLIVVGTAAAPLADGAREAGVEAEVVDDAGAALALLQQWLAPGDSVLVKASRVAGLERVAAAVLDGPSSDQPESAGVPA